MFLKTIFFNPKDLYLKGIDDLSISKKIFYKPTTTLPTDSKIYSEGQKSITYLLSEEKKLDLVLSHCRPIKSDLD